jgi:hypothetical protein
MRVPMKPRNTSAIVIFDSFVEVYCLLFGSFPNNLYRANCVPKTKNTPKSLNFGAYKQ